MRIDQPGTNNGKVSIDMPSTDIVVGRKYCVKVTYIAGPEGVQLGGCVRFKLPGFKLNEFMGALPVSCSNPGVELVCSDKVPAINGKGGSEFFTINYLFVTIEGEPLREGETVSVDYGHQIIPRVAAPQLAQRRKVEVATDLDGSRAAPGSGFYLVGDAPVIHFVSDRPAKIEVTIPSSTVAGESFETVVRVRDRYNNIVPDYAGTIRLLSGSDLTSSVVETYTFTPDDQGVGIFEDTVFDRVGVNRLAVMDEGYGLYARSNPSKTTREKPLYRLFWGETHSHSSISADSSANNDYIPRPTGVYDYARNASDLDFCMVTDHSQDLVEEDWVETQKAAATCYQPGRFVTFSAFEATHQPLRRDGDKNVYFITDDEAYFDRGSTEDLYRDLKQRRNKVMVIPHQHARTNWACHDPDLERVVEMYAHWGCGLSPESEPPMIPGTRLRAENYVSHALEQGIKVGFIASADHSGGHPGDDFWWGLSNYQGGLAAVYAPSLTREGIWDGLWNRHCYGTTRARILVEFEINGHLMGEEFSPRPGERGERRLIANVYGTAAIHRVEIVKNGRIWASEPGNQALDVELDCTDREAERETDYYYVHVVQEDGEQAWSSPIWVTVPALGVGTT